MLVSNRRFYEFRCAGWALAFGFLVSASAYAQVSDSEELALKRAPEQSLLNILIDSAENPSQATLKVVANPRTGKASHLHFINPKAKQESRKDLYYSLASLNSPQPLIEKFGIDVVTIHLEKNQLVIKYKPGALGSYQRVSYLLNCDGNGLNCQLLDRGQNKAIQTVRVVTYKKDSLLGGCKKDTGIEKIVTVN